MQPLIDHLLQTAMATYRAKQHDAADATLRLVLGHEDSPWYPSLCLFRQKTRGNWTRVLQAVAANLRAWAIRRS